MRAYHYFRAIMKKYLSLIKTEWQRQLTYRFTVLSHRIANTIEIVVQIIIWSAIFSQYSEVKGYTYNQMMTYIIIGWMVAFVTANYGFETVISRDIQNGSLSNYIIKPISYIRYIVIHSIGRASLAISSGVIIQSIIVFIFRGNIVVTSDIVLISIGIAMVVLAYFIRLFLSILTGLIAFWIIDVAGITAMLNAFQKFLSGSYFPADLLPAAVVQISSLLPFVYTFFVPTKVFLGNYSRGEAIVGLGIEGVWLVLLYVLVLVVWKFGLRKFEGVGI